MGRPLQRRANTRAQSTLMRAFAKGYQVAKLLRRPSGLTAVQLAASSAHRAPSPCAAARSGVRMPAKKDSNAFAALGTLSDALQEVDAAQEASSSGAQSIAKDKPASKPVKLHDPLVWIDLEMTGLDIDKDTVIEIAVIVTDGQLHHVIEGPAFAIHQSEEVLAGMNEWCQEHHGASGLTQRVRESTIDMQQAEKMVLDFVKQHVPESRSAQLAGNSIHVDRMFLNKYMPELIEHLHYRIVDVSTIKELARRWFPKDYKTAPRKKLAHTALSDIRESIEELKHWRKAIFKSK